LVASESRSSLRAKPSMVVLISSYTSLVLDVSMSIGAWESILKRDEENNRKKSGVCWKKDRLQNRISSGTTKHKLT
jgi:hypothetical protein